MSRCPESNSLGHRQEGAVPEVAAERGQGGAVPLLVSLHIRAPCLWTPCPLSPGLEEPAAAAHAAAPPRLPIPPCRWLLASSREPSVMHACTSPCQVLRLLNVLGLVGDVFVTPSGQGPSSVPSAQDWHVVGTKPLRTMG